MAKIIMGKITREKKVESIFIEIYQSVKELCEDVRIEKINKTTEGQLTIANFSCLAAVEKEVLLGQLLSEIERSEGFSVEFTGPWPPYSFVNKIKLSI